MKYLTIKEKKELILVGKQVPLCVSENGKEEKKRKKEKKRLFSNFAKNVLGE